MIVSFSPEEQVEAFGEKLTLRMDFRAITGIEGALEMPLPLAIATIRSGACPRNVLVQVLWHLTREYNSDLTHSQITTIVMDKTQEGSKVGFALDALLDRISPLSKEDRKPTNPPKRNGRSKSTAVNG